MVMRNLINAPILAFFLANTCLADAERLDPESAPELINLEQAARLIVVKDVSSRVLGAQTVGMDGKDIHLIKILTPNGYIRYYKIDAGTGELVN